MIDPLAAIAWLAIVIELLLIALVLAFEGVTMPAGFWSSIAKGLIKLAVYALGHPEEVQRVLNVVKDAHRATSAP